MTNTKSTFVRKIKRMSRKAPVRIVAVVLMVALVMNVSSVVTLLPVFAGNNTATTVQGDSPTASVTNDDLQISGSNSFGNLLATKVNDYQNSGNEDEYTEGYSVIGIEMNGKTATVEYNAVENCMLVVGVYTDDGVKMLGSGNATVSPDSQSTNVEIAISEMPQYYLVKAFLVNPANNYPLCKAYTCELYTKSIQEVIESTVEDYPDREILNLDGDNTTNFAVYDLGVNVIKQSEGKNTYLAGDSNPDSGKYVFANADSEFASLKVGDVFSHERGAEVIIAKVKSIEAIPNGDGTYTLTIIEDNNIDMEDVFDYVKIENNGKINSYTIDNSVADECVKIPSENEEPSSGSSTGNFSNTVTPKEYNSVDIDVGLDAINIERELVSKKGSTNSNAQHSDEDDPIVANVEFSIKLKLKVGVSLKVYISFSECYLEYKSNINASLNGTISGSITVNPFTICKLDVSPVPGVFISFEPKPEFSASASLTLDLSFTQSVGFKCSTKSGLKKIDSEPVVKLKVGVEGKLFFGINFKPALSIISDKVAEASMTAKVGVEIVGKLNFIDSSTSDSDSKKHDCEHCVDGDFNFVFELSATVKFLKSEKLTYSQKIIPKIKIKIGDWYWSVDHDEFGLGTCPYISYKVTLTISKADSQPVSDVLIYNSSDMSKELAKTDENGKAVFYLPNGEYKLNLLKDEVMVKSFTIQIKDASNSFTERLNTKTGKCGDDITYTLYDNGVSKGLLELSGSGKMYDYNNSNYAATPYFTPWYASSFKSIKKVTFSGEITSIGDKAFSGLSELRSITLPDTITSIGGGAFYYCHYLTSINIPNSCTSIGGGAFVDCGGLRIITIPKSVISIGQEAFVFCHDLDVYYEGSEEDWKNISIGKNNSELTGANIHYNSTGPSSSPTPMRAPNASSVLKATFNDLIPNENYLFVVSKSSDLDNMLDAENLLFIDEKTAGDSGSLTFSYIPREDYDGVVVKIFGPVNPSVTLDTTSATLKKGEKLTLTATVDQGHSANDVVWSSSNDKIATVSKGQVTAVGFGDAEISARLDDCVVKCVVSVVPDLDFTILGASIRLSEPYGIRFGIQLGKGGDYTNVKIVEYGTLMKPTQLLGDEELTLQTAKIQKIPSTVTYSETDAALVYTGVLINIPTTYFDTAVSGRGYFIYEDENGVNHTIYTDTVSMSFNDVVEAAYNKYSKLTNPTDAQKVVLQKLEKLRALSGNN